MAATLPPPPPDNRHWEQVERPRSQTPSEQRDRPHARKRSPNRVRAKPAKPAVISSILESFDTLPPSPIITADDNFSDTGSRQSRPPSTDGSTVASLPSLVRSASPGFGVEYGAGLSLNDEVGVSNAALPPTVRTARPASGLSRYSAPRTPSFTGANGKLHSSAVSIRSRRSSFSAASKVDERSPSRNKLSAESWVKQNTASQEPVETKESRMGRKSLRRIDSQETLRVTGTRIELVPPVNQTAEAPTISRAERIIAKASTPPLVTSKGRLYLVDSDSTEGQSLTGSLTPLTKTSSLETTPSIGTERSVESKRTSPKQSPIVDSIPMRTSSLRQSSSPAPGKKRERKSKRQTESKSKADSKVDSVLDRNSKSIPESSWADLGDDDDTVRRIRELREQRKSRLLESKTYSTPENIPTLPTDIHLAEPVEHANAELVSARRSEDGKQGSHIRPAANRASTEPPSKAQRVLGMSEGDFMQVSNGILTNRTNRMSPELMKRRPLSPYEERRPWVRPATAKSSASPTPPLSLDYSYAEAVDALHGAEREYMTERKFSIGQSTRSSLQAPRTSLQTPRNSLQIKGLDLPASGTKSVETTPVRRRSKRLSKKVPEEQRWTTHDHPDLPLEFSKKKDRRKSMSDARHPRHFEAIAEPVPRRDSTEIAVDEYLRNERLSCKIKHPLTGRVISFSEVGDPKGAAVFICVGMGLTRYVTAFYDELATTLRLRLITVDRPGVGGSQPYPATDRSGPLSWPDDVLAICQHLGVGQFSMLAHSAGAIYALATALILPHLIRGKVHLLAPWIPPSQLEAISHPATSAPPAGALPRSQRLLRVLPTPFLKAANSSFMTATSASLKPATRRRSHNGKPEPQRRQESPAAPPSRGRDRPPTRDARPSDFHGRRESLMLMDQFMPELNAMEIFPIPLKEEDEDVMPSGSLVMSATASPMDPNLEFASTALNAAEHAEKERKAKFTNALTQRTWELATRDSNPATDLLVCLERHRDVGFRYTDVHRDIVITHGSEDKRVPVANVRWLAEQMSRRSLPAVVSGTESVPQSREGRSAEMLVQGGCEIRILEGEGHGLMASPTIMGDVLTEIAGYWSGQNKGRMM